MNTSETLVITQGSLLVLSLIFALTSLICLTITTSAKYTSKHEKIDKLGVVLIISATILIILAIILIPIIHLLI